MTSIMFREKEVRTPIMRILVSLLVFSMLGVALILQPLFWLFGFRGLLLRNEGRSVSCKCEGAFSRNRRKGVA